MSNCAARDCTGSGSAALPDPAVDGEAGHGKGGKEQQSNFAFVTSVRGGQRIEREVAGVRRGESREQTGGGEGQEAECGVFHGEDLGGL